VSTVRSRSIIAGLVLSALLGVLIGAGGYTFHSAHGLSYLSSDPRACVNCHIMREQFDGWQKASHHAHATCNDCHTPHNFVGKYYTKAENGFWHSKGFTLQDFHEPIMIRPKNRVVLDNACLHCHQQFVNEVVSHGPASETTFDCVRCHSQVGHGARW
jgi:cytochrome c nitrite reductase small subunit